MCANSSAAPAPSGAGLVLAESVMSYARPPETSTGQSLASPRGFRYVRNVGQAKGSIRSWVALLLAFTVAGVVGCGRKSKTPAEAFRRFADAVNSGDGGALFDALDQPTRWNW